MGLTYARRAVGCGLWGWGARRWELQDPRDHRNEHALTRKARKRTAHPDPAEHLIARGPGTAQMALYKAAVRRVGGHGDGGQSPRPGSVMRGCERGRRWGLRGRRG
eukprot:2284130-Prymnesium_polylepis.1